MNNLLSSKYNREEWIDFLQTRFLPNDFKLKKQTINIDFKSKHIKPQAYWIGDCSSLDNLAVLEISHTSENDPRIGVSRDAFRLMAELNLSRALFFFVSDNSSNFRFSLITLELKLQGTDVKYKFSNPKRFSFYLGEDAKIRTPESFLFKSGRISDFEDLQSRFSIEVVNKEFYQEIQRMFYLLVGGRINHGSKVLDYEPMLKLPDTSDAKTRQEFGVRLIGRLVFCWFLKKKLSDKGNPLIPDDVISLEAVKDAYYHQVLEPLFFEVLNTPLQQRHTLYRNPLYDSIPFLNGGLFDPSLHRDFYISSSAIHMAQPAWNLKIPDQWFRELFTNLETYNFTIDENTSIDVDLSVDPEMLGRIFENLLAELNPETGETARKATGSYYTPRAIVEFMVNEAIIQYLLNKTDISEPILRELLDYSIENTYISKNQQLELINALDNIKVIDPACGSGAFPIGILQKMLLILQKVDPESIEWVIRQLDKIPNRLVRQALEEKLMSENWKYKHKMGIIQNAIYGVDIQPIATEISKLRLFLSLIVDETVIEAKENKNINPLPNLSFKFVCANSLISLGAEKVTLVRYQNIIKGFDDIRERYLHAHTANEKEQIRKDFATLNQSLMDNLTGDACRQSSFLDETQTHIILSSESESYLYRLLNWDPFQDKASSWFDPKWMFGVNDGFDIVIGNPPYVSAVSMKRDKSFKETVKRDYPQLSGSYDLYTIFLLLGVRLLSSDGVYTWIVPNKFLVSDYAKESIKYLRNKGLQYSIDVSSFKVFGNTGVYPVIIAGNIKLKDNYKSYVLRDFDDLLQRNLIEHEAIKGYKSFKDYGFKIQSGTTGFQALSIKRFVSEIKSIDSIPFAVSGSVDRYRYSNENVRYMKSTFKEAYITYDDSIAKSKWEFWTSEKIIIAGMTKIIEAAYSESPLALGVGIYGITSTGNFDKLSVLALLNSDFFTHYLKTNFRDKHLSGGYLAINKSTIESLPMVEVPRVVQDKLSLLAKMVLSLKTENKSTTVFEDIIDLITYKLFDIKFNEMEILNPSAISVLERFGLSKIDYERMSVVELSQMKVF